MGNRGRSSGEDYLDRVFAPLVETVPYATLRAAAPPESRLVRARRWMDRGGGRSANGKGPGRMAGALRLMRAAAGAYYRFRALRRTAALAAGFAAGFCFLATSAGLAGLAGAAVAAASCQVIPSRAMVYSRRAGSYFTE